MRKEFKIECDIFPLGKFGKDYMKYSGCYWCDHAEECKKVEDQKKEKVYK